MQTHRKDQPRIVTSKLKRKLNQPKHKFECYLCKKTFPTSTSAWDHMRVHNKDYRSCFVCRERYVRSQGDKHLCIQQQPISCEYCSKAFSSTKRLLEHLVSAHNERKMYKCCKCTKHFGMIFLKNIHERSHDTVIPYNCNMCSKSYSMLELLTSHQRRDHMNQGCKVVNPSSTSNSHIVESSHLCHQCGKTFPTQSKLAMHMQTHGEPKFKCPHCPRIFFTKVHLHRHSHIHRNVTFVCSICERELSTPCGLRKHMSKFD